MDARIAVLMVAVMLIAFVNQAVAADNNTDTTTQGSGSESMGLHALLVLLPAIIYNYLQ
jgi:heme/copper-type cytochrome/quinol oxidase subunit 2